MWRMKFFFVTNITELDILEKVVRITHVDG